MHGGAILISLIQCLDIACGIEALHLGSGVLGVLLVAGIITTVHLIVALHLGLIGLA